MWFTFQFAKQLLEGTSAATELDPGHEGGKIAVEVLDASDSLRELCSKCGWQLTGGGPLFICTGICKPHQSFHSKCVPKSQRTDQDFKCLVCRPADREYFCLCCNGALTDDIVMCGSNNVNRYTNFVHHLCLAKGCTSYRCGICWVKLIVFTTNTNVFKIVEMFSMHCHVLLIFKCVFVNFHVLNTKIKCKKDLCLQNQCSFINFFLFSMA